MKRSAVKTRAGIVPAADLVVVATPRKPGQYSLLAWQRYYCSFGYCLFFYCCFTALFQRDTATSSAHVFLYAPVRVLG